MENVYYYTKLQPSLFDTVQLCVSFCILLGAAGRMHVSSGDGAGYFHWS